MLYSLLNELSNERKIAFESVNGIDETNEISHHQPAAQNPRSLRHRLGGPAIAPSSITPLEARAASQHRLGVVDDSIGSMNTGYFDGIGIGIGIGDWDWGLGLGIGIGDWDWNWNWNELNLK